MAKSVLTSQEIEACPTTLNGPSLRLMDNLTDLAHTLGWIACVLIGLQQGFAWI
jgi:hypothetical protein